MAPSDREIVTTRVFAAPRELVFKAWTDPDCVRACKVYAVEANDQNFDRLEAPLAQMA